MGNPYPLNGNSRVPISIPLHYIDDMNVGNALSNSYKRTILKRGILAWDLIKFTPLCQLMLFPVQNTFVLLYKAL